MEFSYPYYETQDGSTGLIYRWKFENGYGISLIDMFSFFQREFGGKYELALIRYHDSGTFYLVSHHEDLPEIGFTSSLEEINHVLELVKRL